MQKELAALYVRFTLRGRRFESAAGACFCQLARAFTKDLHPGARRAASLCGTHGHSEATHSRRRGRGRHSRRPRRRPRLSRLSGRCGRRRPRRVAESVERPVRPAAARRHAAGPRRLLDLRRSPQDRSRSADHHADGQDQRRGYRQRPRARRRRLHRETVLDRAARAASESRAAPLENDARPPPRRSSSPATSRSTRATCRAAAAPSR